MTLLVNLAVLIVLLFSIGCGSKTQTEPSLVEVTTGPDWFEDVTEKMGLNFIHDAGPTGAYFMPQSMGSGVGWIHEFHVDGTEAQYCYLLQNAGPQSSSVNRLYQVLPDGRFQDVTKGSGLDVAGYNMGVAIGDVDNDGLPDVLLTQYLGLKLFRNLGGGRFEDITAASGLSNLLWGTSAAFFDYDRDGWLDLVIVNYLDYNAAHLCHTRQGIQDFCSPMSFDGTSSKLFHNLGQKQGKIQFEDVSVASGLGLVPGSGLGVACADFDGDGWPDIFVANDGMANRLWINQHNGTFVDEAFSRGVAYNLAGHAQANMGVAIGDVMNDGLLDIYVTHLMRETNILWKQGPRGTFRDRTGDTGLFKTHWRGTGFGTLMADFNLDGWLDIAIVNGRVIRGSTAKDTGLGFWETYAERNQLLVNDGTGKFQDLSSNMTSFSGPWNVARGLAVLDFDGDGAPDLLVTRIGERARLYRNQAPNRGHWLKVRAVDPKRNRDDYGAVVKVKIEGGERMRLINPAHSYLSSSTPLGHFGLGSAIRYESISVVWSDGSPVETFPGGAADRAIVIRKGEGVR